MVNWLTVVGVILVFFVIISPIIAIILEELNKRKRENNKEN